MARMFASELSSCECHSTRDNEAILLFNLQILRRCRGSPSHPQASHGVAVCCGGIAMKVVKEKVMPFCETSQNEKTKFSLWAIRPSLTQFSTHQNMVLRASELRKKNRSWNKILWNTNSCGENVFWQKLSFHSPRCLIKILSFFVHVEGRPRRFCMAPNVWHRWPRRHSNLPSTSATRRGKMLPWITW